MSIKLTSTTDSPEAVTAALGDLAEKPIVAGKAAAAAEKPAPEKLEASAAPNESETEAEEGEENEETTEVKPKKQGGFKKRIDKLTARVSAKDQEIGALRQELAKHQKPAPENQSTAPNKTEPTGKPDKDKFESHEEYLEALVDWKADQKLSARDQRQKETQVKTEIEKQVSTHVDKVKAFAESHKDFNELMEDVNDVPMSLTVQQVILDSDNGPELMYELAKNREEYERICKLPAIAAARELGKFEAKFIKPSSVETKETKSSKAPAPIKPLGGKGSGSSKKSIDDPSLSQREYEELRNEQDAKRAKSAW